MSSLLNQKHTFAKLRAELEGRRKRIYQCCKRFGHLAYNYRNKREKIKEKPIPQNKFKVIASRVMQCGVREKVSEKTRDSRRGSEVLQMLGNRIL